MEGLGSTNEASPLRQDSARILGYKDIGKLKAFVSGLDKAEADARFAQLSNLIQALTTGSTATGNRLRAFLHRLDAPARQPSRYTFFHPANHQG